ncbi:long-chain-fatty-acyl-CoA reductase [Halieaceae bacterium IMCC14734]|uniref:Long-chain-fatty-acyl-CoA reductase n=1 Tax=Candidatus Litorirhabdus singularis TaxID=2518993 RepID=A0ABT3TAI5_9GAMM|nr:acyl-CoA reductase [Candidatus Litorirhabdus singularis]MCX2979282.1 long-chain-fatty-acyl-CoA reductase [Candidatus Litorirhabdus singularis]
MSNDQADFSVPLFIRGQLIEDNWVEFGGRGGSATFRAPDIHQYAEQLPLRNPGDMADLYQVSFEEILDVLEQLGQALDFETNAHVQEAFAAGLAASNYPAAMLKASYVMLPSAFSRDAVREIAEQRIGIDYLEGWVEQTLHDGRQLRIRAMGARALHIPAGNGGLVSAVTIIRNVITRSDAIIKAPSNDPLTAMAIVRTLHDIAPDHPITRHLTVAYWKGGDTQLESTLYRPEHIEKIVAWGGFASVKHITQFIQPGLELISLDPKRSTTIIGAEAFASEATLHEVAARAACDIGVANQEACASARVIYVLSGTDAAGIDNINRLGELIYAKLMAMPDYISTKPKTFDRELAEYMDATRLDDTFYRIIGGEDLEGAVIVSQFDEPVDYSPMLSGRVANLVPVDSIDAVTRAVNAYTQTVGIYPDSLKEELRDLLPLYGAQRLTSLGYACSPSVAMPQDAIEPLRRMCKWIVEETCAPDKVFPVWEAQ